MHVCIKPIKRLSLNVCESFGFWKEGQRAWLWRVVSWLCKVVVADRVCVRQGFVKDVVEVADNLQRAAEMVPESVLQGTDADGQPLTPERALALLQSLLQGVHLTERVLQQASPLVVFCLKGVRKMWMSQTSDARVK